MWWSLNLSENFQHEKPHTENNTTANVVFCVILKIETQPFWYLLHLQFKAAYLNLSEELFDIAGMWAVFPPVPVAFSN